MNIKISCNVNDRLPLDKFLPLQGRLKSLTEINYQKLKREIIETGFAYPIYCWQCPDTQQLYIIGGHQRILCLKKMQSEGFIIPDVPYITVFAKDKFEARRRVLQDISQFGTVNDLGLLEFLEVSKIEFSDLVKSFQLPDFNIAQFQATFLPSTGGATPTVIAPQETNADGTIVNDPYKEWAGMPEFVKESQQAFRTIIVHFRNKDDVDEFFRRINQDDTGQTRSLWFPVKERKDTESKRYVTE